MVGFTSVTFRKLSVEQIIELACQAKAECIEWGGDVHVTDTSTARKTAAMCRRNGIAVNSYGSYFTLGCGTKEDFYRQCDIAQALGASVIRVWAGRKSSGHTTEQELSSLVSSGRDVADIAGSYGLTVGMEYHPNTYNDTPLSSEVIIKAVGSDNFRTYWQPRWIGNDLKKLKQMLPNTVNVHLFFWDLLGIRRRPLSAAEDTVGGFVNELKLGGFDGDYILEFVKDDSEECFLADMKTLRRICK